MLLCCRDILIRIFAFYELITIDQLNKQNQMSLIGSDSFNSKVIKRIKIKTRTLTKPEQPFIRTASNNKKEMLPIKSERKEKIFIATAFSENNHNQSCNQNAHDPKDRTNNNFLHLQIPFKNKSSSIIEKDQKLKKTIEQQTAFQKKSAKMVSQISQGNKSNENKVERNRIVHMNYKQYEQIINQQEVSPTYFQNVAKRNDNKLVTKELAKKDIFSIQTKESNTSKLPKAVKRQRMKTTIQEPTSDNSMRVIMGCHLGALSNIQIRQKLEQKWMNQQRETIKNNKTMVFTQQSEIVSETDTRQPTHRQHFSLKNKIGKNKTEKVVKEREAIEWDKIQNDKFKAVLKRILQVKPSKGREGEGQKLYSYGEEYSERQQVLLLARQKLYKSKELVLKHKLQWKK